ncbi:hypothetical protein ABTH30_23640, partial [Acinetobacter baumannii]
LENDDGDLLSEGRLKLTAERANSVRGRIAARGDLHASVTAFNQAGGELSSEGALMLEADSLDNRSGGLVSADGNMTVSAR